MLPILSIIPIETKPLQLTSWKQAKILKYYLQLVLSVVKQVPLGIESMQRELRTEKMWGDGFANNIGIIENVTPDV